MTGAFGPTTVGTSSVQILAADGTRHRARIYNDGAFGYVYLGLGVPAVVGQGTKLAPYGGYWDTDFTGIIYAISSQAGATVCGAAT